MNGTEVGHEWMLLHLLHVCRCVHWALACTQAYASTHLAQQIVSCREQDASWPSPNTASAQRCACAA